MTVKEELIYYVPFVQISPYFTKRTCECPQNRLVCITLSFQFCDIPLRLPVPCFLFIFPRQADLLVFRQIKCLALIFQLGGLMVLHSNMFLSRRFSKMRQRMLDSTVLQTGQSESGPPRVWKHEQHRTWPWGHCQM